MKKGQKMTLEQRSRLSKAKKGLVRTKQSKMKQSETRKKLLKEGKLKSNLIRPKTPKLKGKTMDDVYGKKMACEIRKKQSISHLGKKSWNKGKTKETDSRLAHGERHGNWIGGVTNWNKELRSSEKWKIWRNAVFLRDKFTCQNKDCEYCGNKQTIIHPHHIKPLAIYPDLVFDINNGITYCADYHLKSGLHKNIIRKGRCKNCNCK